MLSELLNKTKNWSDDCESEFENVNYATQNSIT